MAQAEEQARKLTSDTELRLREEVGRLEGMRNQLATDVENMARHLEAERNRIRSALAEVLKWVDENVQPATTLMALRPRASEGARSGAPVSAHRPAGEPAANGAGEGSHGEPPSFDLSGSGGPGPEPGMPSE